MLKQFLFNEERQGMLEYGLIIGTVSIFAVITLSVLGKKTKHVYDSIFPEAVTEVSNPAEPVNNNDSWFNQFLEYLSNLFGRRH
jgi:Flp pilus assembly pilin Flp